METQEKAGQFQLCEKVKPVMIFFSFQNWAVYEEDIQEVLLNQL